MSLAGGCFCAKGSEGLISNAIGGGERMEVSRCVVNGSKHDLNAFPSLMGPHLKADVSVRQSLGAQTGHVRLGNKFNLVATVSWWGESAVVGYIPT